MTTNTATPDLHRMVATFNLDADETSAPDGWTARQWQDALSAAATARAVGSDTSVTVSDGVRIRVTRRRDLPGARYRVAAVVPEREQIAAEAADLLRLMDAAVPSSTVHYAVEDARKALRTLARLAHEVITQSAHLDMGETYREGLFRVTCSCGREFTGGDPSEANIGYMEHAEDPEA